MNKRANIYLNIYATIAFILSLTSMGLTLILGELSYTIPNLLKISTLLIGSVFGLLFIAIEVFLFILLEPKFKVQFSIYILVDIILAIYINTKFPFSAFIIFLVFHFIKNISRIALVETIYMPKEFNRYCKMFNIKIPDFKKKRKKATTKVISNKEELTISSDDDIKISNKKTDSKSVKSYT